jgi:hypothetical protein
MPTLIKFSRPLSYLGLGTYRQLDSFLPLGHLDHSTYTHEHSLTLPTSTLKIEAECTYETYVTLRTFRWCRESVESASAINDRERLKSTVAILDIFPSNRGSVHRL